MGNTPAEIQLRIMSRLKYPASKLEGTFTADNVQALANELGRVYSEDYDRLIERSHVMTATGEDLDVAARENHGMERLEATYEEVNLLFSGVPGTVIDETVFAKADDIIFQVSGIYEISPDGTVLVTAKCTSPGSGNHVMENTVNTVIGNLDGITTVTNPERSSGGYDLETDEEFRERILSKERDVPGYGNIAWYRTAAKEVNGVEKAKVFDIARGLGTVDVVIIAEGNTEASKVLVQRVADHIKEERIAGVDVVVTAGTPFEVSISADIWIKSGYSIASITGDFRKRMEEYLASIEFETDIIKSRVSYAKVSELLIGCEGIQDIEHLTLNGQAVSIELESRSFPVLSGLALALMEG